MHVIRNIEMQMICDIPGKWNSHANSHTEVTCDKPITHSSVIEILCQPIRKLLTSRCHHLYRNEWFNHIQKYTFPDYYMKHILFSFLQDDHIKHILISFLIDHFLVQSQGWSPVVDTSPTCAQRCTHQDHFMKNTWFCCKKICPEKRCSKILKQ